MNAPAIRLLLTLAVGLAAPAARAQEKKVPDLFAGFPGFAEQSMARWNVPGLAVAVVQDGEVVYLRGFGLRDLERQLPVTPQTLFPIGSATKGFTAAAVAMLAEQEKLDLDAPLVRYLPDLLLHDEHASWHATPRDLLLHRTGVPAYDFLWVAVPLSREEYFRRLRYLPPSRAFRESFQYSNLMYTALGVLVGRLSGGTWEEFVAGRIFQPLAMRRSNFSVDQLQRSEDFAAPYAHAGGKLQRIPFRQVEATGPASSINSSAEEMARWLVFHLNRGAVDGKQLLAPARVAEMHRGQIRITDPVLVSLVQASEYGLGWYVSNYRGHAVVEHAGGIDGFVALVSLLPAEKIGVVVLSNGDRTLLPYVLVRNLYDRLLGLDPIDRNAEFEKVLDDAMRAWGAGSEAAAGAEHAASSPSLPLAAYAGSYEHPAFGGIEITHAPDGLHGAFAGQSFVLRHVDGERFAAQGSALAGRTLRFQRDPGGLVRSLSVSLEPAVADIVFTRPARH